MATESPSKNKFKLTDKQQLSEYITDLAWSVDGYLAIATAAGELAIWKEGELNVLASPSNYSIDCLGFSNDGEYIAGAGQKGEIQIWQNAQNSFKLFTTIDNDKAWIDSLAWHPTENILAFVVNRQIKIWDVEQQNQIANLDFQNSSVFNLAWHPNGDLLAASGHGGVKVWSENWQKTPYLLQVPGASLNCAWSSDGAYLASGNLDRTISLLDWGNPPPWLMQGFPGKVSRVTWSKNSDKPLLAAACQEGISVWQQEKSKWHSYILRHEKTVKAIAFSPNSSFLATAGDDGNISLWQGNKLIKSLKGTNNGLSCLVWHPTGKYLAAGGQNGELLVYQESVSGKGFGH